MGTDPVVDRLCDALEAATERFAALLRRDPDPSLPAIGTWSVGETAAHVASSPSHFLATARGELQPERLDEVAAGNAAALAIDPERTPRVLADRLEEADAALVAWVRSVDGDPVVEPFADVEVPLSTVLAIELGELLVHGRDIAKAARLAWRISREEAALTIDGYVPLLPYVVDQRRTADVRLRCELRVRGGSRTVVAIDHGTLRVEPPSATSVDCHLSVDPAAFLLLTFRRISVPAPILRGQMAVWGRRPWLAMRLQTSLKTI